VIELAGGTVEPVVMSTGSGPVLQRCAGHLLGLTLGLSEGSGYSNLAVRKRFHSPPGNAGNRKVNGMQNVAAHPAEMAKASLRGDDFHDK